MEDKVEERSPILIATGIGALIVTLLLVFGLLARSQMPVEVATANNNGDADVVLAEAIDETDAGEAGLPVSDEVENAEASNEDASDETEEGTSSEATSSEATSSEATENEAKDESDIESDVEAEAPDTETVADSGTADDTAQAETEAPISTTSTVVLTDDELLVAFAAGGCSSCHIIPNIVGAVGELGPDLTHIGTVAATRIDGLSAEDYLRQSLVEPDAYIVEECPTGPCLENLMQASNIAVLSEQEVEGMLSYMLSLTDGAEAATAEEAALPAEEAAEEAAAEEPSAEEAALDMAVVSTIVTKGTCGACHVIPGVDSAVGMVGPDLTGIGAAAATRIEGYTAEEYLHESITDPNAFIAPECPTGDCLANIMLPNLVDLLTEEEINTIVSYLSDL